MYSVRRSPGNGDKYGPAISEGDDHETLLQNRTDFIIIPEDSSVVSTVYCSSILKCLNNSSSISSVYGACLPFMNSSSFHRYAILL